MYNNFSLFGQIGMACTEYIYIYTCIYIIQIVKPKWLTLK